MSITPNVPQPNEPQVVEAPATPRWILLLFVVLFLGIGGVVYAGYTSRDKLNSDLAAANQRSDVLNKQLDQTNSRIAELRGQLDVTSQKLGLTQDELARARSLAQQIQKQQQDSDAQLGAQIGQVQETQKDTDAKIGQVSTDLGGAKTDIASTKKDLDDTRNTLKSTIGDLGQASGRIARNEGEVEALKRLNERNIFDFNLTKTKAPQHIGPIQVTLRSTDPKKYRFTITVVADDKSIEKKDRNVDEPLQFYVTGVHTPYEIVVFQVTKDKISGYLSTPKETAAAAAPAPAAPGTKTQ